jgi:hypothetical protein
MSGNSLRLPDARPMHALTHYAAQYASLGGHAPAGDMDSHGVLLITPSVERSARPTLRSRWLQAGDKRVADLFVVVAAPDPGVDPAKVSAAGFDPDTGLAVAAGPIAEKRRSFGERRVRRPERRQRARQNPGPTDRARRLPDRCPRISRGQSGWRARRNRGRHPLPPPENPQRSSSDNSPTDGESDHQI